MASDRDHVTGDRRVVAQKDASAQCDYVPLHPAIHHDASTHGNHISAGAFHSNRAADANQVACVFVPTYGYALTKVDLVAIPSVKRLRRNHEKQQSGCQQPMRAMKHEFNSSAGRCG
jgi:hypothetical protein